MVAKLPRGAAHAGATELDFNGQQTEGHGPLSYEAQVGMYFGVDLGWFDEMGRHTLALRVGSSKNDPEMKRGMTSVFPIEWPYSLPRLFGNPLSRAKPILGANAAAGAPLVDTEMPA